MSDVIERARAVMRRARQTHQQEDIVAALLRIAKAAQVHYPTVTPEDAQQSELAAGLSALKAAVREAGA